MSHRAPVIKRCLRHRRYPATATEVYTTAGLVLRENQARTVVGLYAMAYHKGLFY